MGLHSDTAPTALPGVRVSDSGIAFGTADACGLVCEPAIDTIPRIAISACRTPASQGSAAAVEKMLPDRVSIGPRIPV